MHMKNTGLLMKVAALLAALMMLTAVIAIAQAEAPADWDGMVFSLTWFDGNGEQQTAQAVPVYDQPGSFWICVPADANMAGLFFDASHPWHEFTFDPMPGSTLPVPADADPAEPGDEAVQRGEEVVRLVNPIEEAHARVPEARSVRLRLRHRRREENEKEKAYGFPEEVGAEKAVGSPARKRRDPAVQEEPENEAREEIKENRPGKKRDRSVDRKRQTIMALSLRQKAGKLEGDLIAQQRKDEGEPEIPFF